MVATRPTRETNPANVATLMVGHEVLRGRSRRASQPPGNIVLEVNGLSVPGGPDSSGLTNVSFTIRAGEILAVAGVEGNGQRELVEVLVGLRRPTAGRVAIGGTPLDGSGRGKSAALGVHLIPDDRQAEGLVLEMTLSENVVLDRVSTPANTLACWSCAATSRTIWPATATRLASAGLQRPREAVQSFIRVRVARVGAANG